MKKSTKILITAVAIASIVGVGAVSYAAWTGGGVETKEVSGNTGSVRTIGDITVTPSDATGSAITALNALYPVDYRGDGVTYWEFTLSADITEGTPVYYLAGELSSGVSAKLYWSAETPTTTMTVDAQKELSATPKKLEGLTDDTVYVYMVATGTDAMKADITLTFSAS